MPQLLRLRPRTGLLAALIIALFATAAQAASPPTIRVTVISDSVGASIAYVPSARAALSHGLRARLDLRVCRRLVEPSCVYQGAAPPTALEAVRDAGRSLGDVLVVDVGYNDDPSHYRAGMRLIERAAKADGAKAIVWVTLHDTHTGYDYAATNAAIAAEGKAVPGITLADWNAYSAGKPWFSGDGLHMDSTGANALAFFLRVYVRRAYNAATSSTS